jgi:hypothetical protein
MGAMTIAFILGAIEGFPDLKTAPIFEWVAFVGVCGMLIGTSGWAFYVSLKKLKEYSNLQGVR